ncbi:MAG: helix-turn-helix domain-containing protein [Synergistaceae bacterium]|nr:helix-turn-helix domain-containing protein [Synergistaceae bacterium]
MSGRRIVESMKEAVAIARGELPETDYRVYIPERVDVKAIRNRLGLSQASFAASFGLSLYTLRNWEQGKRQPEHAARAYLKVIEKAPETVKNALASSVQ